MSKSASIALAHSTNPFSRLFATIDRLLLVYAEMTIRNRGGRVRLSTWFQMVMLMAPIFGAILLPARPLLLYLLPNTSDSACGRRGGSSSSVACDELLTLDVPNCLAASRLAG